MEDRVIKRAEELQEELHKTVDAVLEESSNSKIEYGDVAVVFILHKIASLQCVVEELVQMTKESKNGI